MAHSKLVQIDAFFDGVSAHQAKNWLDQEGISSFIENTNANSTLYLGSALASVKLLVAKEDQEHANKLLKQYHTEKPTRSAWFCGECEEFNEPSFDLCWSCGKVREEVETPAPTKNNKDDEDLTTDEMSFSEIPERTESGNPYQPPFVMLPAREHRAHQSGAAEDELTEQAEELIQRAWRASIFGLGIPILQWYSVILLLGVNYQIPISEKSKRQLKLAWSINIVTFFLMCFFFGAVLLR